MTFPMKTAATLAAALIAIPSRALAAEAATCSSRITRMNLVPCALRASLAAKAEGYEVEAAEGRKLSASSFLPSNPVLSVSAARRSLAGDVAYNWDAAISQEVELAGQRGVRREAAQAEIDARTERAVVARRTAAAAAWAAFFEALAAREEQRLAERLVVTTQALSIAAQARAAEGLIAPVDAEIADAASISVFQAKFAAERSVTVAEASLMSLLGLNPTDPPPSIEGELTPMAGVDDPATLSLSKNIAERPEVAAIDSERRAFELRADAFRRARIPNPTFSAFVQNDGFSERVFGLGVSLPIPLPGNLGHGYAGEIAEAEASVRRAEAERELLAREIRLKAVTALRAYETWSKEVEAFTPQSVGRAETAIRALGEEIETGRVSVRDAFVMQQAFIALLQARVATRKAWCLASVDLVLALGLPLERGSR